MKKLILTLLAGLLFATCSMTSHAQDTLFVELRNPVTIPGSPAQLQFDIYVRGNNAGTYPGAIITYLQFVQADLGTSPAVTLSKLSMFPSPAGDVYTAKFSMVGSLFNTSVDNGFNLFGTPPANFIELPTTYQPYVRVTMDYPGSTIVPTTIDLLQDATQPTPYDDGQFKTPTSGFLPVNYAFSYGTSSLSFGSLPVEWLNFSAERQSDSRIRLDWSTATEINNDFFKVQRSMDGQIFEDIAQVDGVGTSSEEQNYQYFDGTYPSTNTLYYRLKQVDVSGATDFSPIAKVNLDGDKPDVQFFLYPNPAIQVAFVNAEILGELQGEYHLTMVDVQGREIYAADLSADNNRARINIEGLPQGIYYYQVTKDLDVVKQGRFLKVKQ